MFRPWEIIEKQNGNILSDEKQSVNIQDVLIEDKNSNINKNTQNNRATSYNALDLKTVYSYLLDKIYPSNIKTTNEKLNFRKQCKPYTLDGGTKLRYTKKIKNTSSQKFEERLVPVVLEQAERQKIMSMIHQGTDLSVESISLSGHRGRDAVLSIIQTRFYWPNMYSDVVNYIKMCDVCQKVDPATLKTVSKLQSISVPISVMKQIGVDIASLPEVNGKKYIIVAIDYFSKWSKIEAIENKIADTVARFLFKLICRHSCMSIQINDQGREFVNRVSSHLHELTGTKQRVTSAYHPQSNGLVERQNRTIKNMLLKTLYNERNVDKWQDVIDGVLFAHRSVRHETTKYSPFFLLYNREPKLPVDVDVEDFTDEIEQEVPIHKVCTEIPTEDVLDVLNFSKKIATNFKCSKFCLQSSCTEHIKRSGKTKKII